MTSFNSEYKRNYLVFYTGVNSRGNQSNGLLTRLTHKDLLTPDDVNNVFMAQVIKDIEKDYGYTDVILTNIIYRGLTPVTFDNPQIS